MNLHSIVSEMRRGVVRHEEEFARGRERQTALSTFPDLGAFLQALPLAEQMDHAKKHAVTMALVHEYAASTSPLWPGLLLIAFEPMLVAACSKAAELPNDERGSLVFTSFLEAAQSLARAAYVRSAPGFLKFKTLLNVRVALVEDVMDSDVEFVPYDEDQTCTSPRAMFENPLDDLIDERRRVEREAAQKQKEAQKRQRASWRAKKARQRAKAAERRSQAAE